MFDIISSICKTIYETTIEALFPLSPAEKELFCHAPEKIIDILPPAPQYSGLAVPLPEGRSLFAYKDKRVEQLIWNIKYKKSKQAVKIGGYALFRKLNKMFRSSDTLLIIPIPITKQRRRERGYNQCELLVNEIKQLFEQNEVRGVRFIFENNLLIRTHHDSRHTLKGRADRVESAKGIFEVNEERFKMLDSRISDTGSHTLSYISFIKNVHVIIIDDVITTGSTMREAIDTMKKSGFINVSGLSVAH